MNQIQLQKQKQSKAFQQKSGIDFQKLKQNKLTFREFEEQQQIRNQSHYQADQRKNLDSKSIRLSQKQVEKTLLLNKYEDLQLLNIQREQRKKKIMQLNEILENKISENKKKIKYSHFSLQKNQEYSSKPRQSFQQQNKYQFIYDYRSLDEKKKEGKISKTYELLIKEPIIDQSIIEVIPPQSSQIVQSREIIELNEKLNRLQIMVDKSDQFSQYISNQNRSMKEKIEKEQLIFNFDQLRIYRKYYPQNNIDQILNNKQNQLNLRQQQGIFYLEGLNNSKYKDICNKMTIYEAQKLLLFKIENQIPWRQFQNFVENQSSMTISKDKYDFIDYFKKDNYLQLNTTTNALKTRFNQ